MPRRSAAPKPAAARAQTVAPLPAPEADRPVGSPLAYELLEPTIGVPTGPAFGGLDEAGRGPVLGPLVLAGVAGPDLDVFSELGCTDSKLLAPDRRKAIDRALRAQAGVRIAVRIVDATVLDAERRQGLSLNQIELRRFQDIALELGAANVWVDAADVDAERFGAHLKVALPRGVAVVSEHKADLNHPIVGAASIVAKVARDKAVAQLARRLERKVNLPLGSGYSHDPLTRAFLAAYWAQHRELPEGTRTTWATARDLVAPRQADLADYP